MGRLSPTDPDRFLWGTTATLTAAGQTSAACDVRAPTWFALAGTFTGGSVSLEVSFDGGATFVPYFGAPNEPLALFTPGAMLIPGGCEPGTMMRMRCDALATGSISARLSGGGVF